MKAQEMRAMTSEELSHRLDELYTELFNLRFQQALGQIENPMRLRLIRREIARTNTILKEKHERA